jgi:NodT family efflux transporter outer membrane factor (OMF) lipoprotein
MDIWGEQSSLAESAKLLLWQSAFDRDNVQRNMVATLTSSYVEYLSLNDRLQIAHETEVVLADTLANIEKRVDVGDATRIDFDQQKAAIFAVRATIPSLEQLREDALITIAFLVGTVPGALKLSSYGLESLHLPVVVPALPSSLLLRRPDVRMAEARLLAADADVDVARARILPPLDLSAQLGYSSLSMTGLFQPSSFFWNALANLTASIFDGGKLASEKAMAQTNHEEMVETYARTIFQAVREVESALATVRLSGKRLEAQWEASASARRAWDSSAEVYAVGGLDHLALLDAGRTYHRYLDEYQRIKMDRYRGYISLFQAMGGGVDFAERLPGKGVRPVPVRGDDWRLTSLASPLKVSASEGVDWLTGASLEEEGEWQVELPGLYHRSTVDATSRDLRARYGKLMESRVLLPRLHGQIDGAVHEQVSWYRLSVGRFANVEVAHEFCAELLANYQRCRVVSSRSDETVAAPLFLPTSAPLNNGR